MRGLILLLALAALALATPPTSGPTSHAPTTKSPTSASPTSAAPSLRPTSGSPTPPTTNTPTTSPHTEYEKNLYYCDYINGEAAAASIGLGALSLVIVFFVAARNMGGWSTNIDWAIFATIMAVIIELIVLLITLIPKNREDASCHYLFEPIGAVNLGSGSPAATYAIIGISFASAALVFAISANCFLGWSRERSVFATGGWTRMRVAKGKRASI